MEKKLIVKKTIRYLENFLLVVVIINLLYNFFLYGILFIQNNDLLIQSILIFQIIIMLMLVETFYIYGNRIKK